MILQKGLDSISLMKRIKLSDQEILAVIINLQKELRSAFEMLSKKSKDAEHLKDQILLDLDRLLVKEYRIDIHENNLYDSVFKNLDKVAKVS